MLFMFVGHSDGLLVFDEHVDCICSVGAFWSILIELTYKGYNLLCDADQTNKEKSEMYRPVQFMDVDY